MRLGAGAHLLIGSYAIVDVQRGFCARRDLTLVVTGRLTIGRDMFCNRGVAIAVLNQVTIGESVRIGERTSILDHNHVIEPLDDLEARFREYETAPISVGDRVLISANCVILAGAEIGADSVIGAGSVVRGKIPAGVLAAGIPARVIRELR
jgi:acetyltransferase-like isoleucine patch superfamily enzyme